MNEITHNRNNYWLSRFTFPFRLTKVDYFLIIVPALLWLTLVNLREHVINTRCVDSQNCLSSEIPKMDLPGYYIENPGADLYSFYTQNLSGITLTVGALSGLLITGTAAAPITGIVMGLEATVLNGLTTELTRIITQRPRPFVYHNPSAEAPWPAHYVSFYSGHTSFAMAANLMLLFLLISWRSPKWLIVFSILLGQSLVYLTAIYRVLAGRHFISDTLAGFLGATLVTFCLAWWHPRKIQEKDSA